MTLRSSRLARKLHLGPGARASRLPRARALDVPMVHQLGARLLPQLAASSQPDRLAPGWLAIDALEAGHPRRSHPIDRLYEQARAVKRDAVRGVAFLASLAASLWFIG